MLSQVVPAVGVWEVPSVWQDFESKHRTLAGIEKRLKQGVKNGEWVAWRLITIHKEVMGNAD